MHAGLGSTPINGASREYVSTRWARAEDEPVVATALPAVPKRSEGRWSVPSRQIARYAAHLPSRCSGTAGRAAATTLDR